MKEQILFLVELQNINFEIDELTRREVNLPKEIARLDEELDVIERELVESRQRMDKLKADYKTKETALKNGVETLKKAKGRLLEVKTNKEYEATLKEIDAINEKNSVIEDEIIQMLEDVDRADEDFKTKESEAAGRRSRGENEIRKIKEEQESIGSTLENILKKRDSVRNRIEAKLLKRFDVIKDRKNGRTVVSVWREVCSGCYMNIPPQMYNELRRNERLMLCPHCGGIMYWEDRENNV